MKYVIAIIEPHRLDPVRQALGEIGVIAMTASEVGGIGRQKGQQEIYRGAEYLSQLIAKVRLEIALSDSLAGRAVEIIREVANTGAIGAGKIFTVPLESVARIRTGETGEAALGQAD